MRVEDDLVLEEQDFIYILGEFLRSYLFHHKNVIPERILIPKISYFTVPKESMSSVSNKTSTESVAIPVNFVEPVETKEPEVAKTEDEIREDQGDTPSLADLAVAAGAKFTEGLEKPDVPVRRVGVLGDIPATETVSPSDPDAPEQDESE